MIQGQHLRANLIARIIPVQRARFHAAAAALIVFHQPVIFCELLAVLDHRRARRGEERDRKRLRAIPLQRPGVIARTGLPGNVGMIVVGEVDRGDFAGIQSGVIVQRLHQLCVDASSPQVIEAQLIQLVVPIAGGAGDVDDVRSRQIDVLQRQRKVLASLAAVMVLNIFQQLRQAARIVLDVEVDRIVEADAVDVEIVDPVEAHIADEFLRAAAVIIEIEQAGKTAAKSTDVRTILRILV